MCISMGENKQPGRYVRTEKKKKKKNEAKMRSGRRPSPEDGAAVCWYDQPYDIYI